MAFPLMFESYLTSGDRGSNDCKVKREENFFCTLGLATVGSPVWTYMSKKEEILLQLQIPS